MQVYKGRKGPWMSDCSSGCCTFGTLLQVQVYCENFALEGSIGRTADVLLVVCSCVELRSVFHVKWR